MKDINQAFAEHLITQVSHKDLKDNAYDSHPQYLTSSRADMLYEIVDAVFEHVSASNPHPQYLSNIDAIDCGVF